MKKSFNLYVWHFNGAIDYSDKLFENLTSYRGGIVENNDILVILKRYPRRDFYNLAFPNPPEDKTRFEYVRKRYCLPKKQIKIWEKRLREDTALQRAYEEKEALNG